MAILTFEKIRDIERAEHEGKDLQKLPDKFFVDLKDYLRRKDTGAQGQELKNIKNTVKRLYDLRERKLVELSLFSARTGLPVENLTPEEQQTMQSIVTAIKAFKENFFEEMKKEPEYTEPAAEESKYMVKKTLPPFMGPDLNVYELKENDIIESSRLPKVLNDLLLKEGVIEKVV